MPLEHELSPSQQNIQSINNNAVAAEGAVEEFGAAIHEENNEVILQAQHDTNSTSAQFPITHALDAYTSAPFNPSIRRATLFEGATQCSAMDVLNRMCFDFNTPRAFEEFFIYFDAMSRLQIILNRLADNFDTSQIGSRALNSDDKEQISQIATNVNQVLAALYYMNVQTQFFCGRSEQMNHLLILCEGADVYNTRPEYLSVLFYNHVLNNKIL